MSIQIDFDLKDILNQINQKLDKIDDKFEQKLDKIDERLKSLEKGQTEIRGEIKRIDSNIYQRIP